MLKNHKIVIPFPDPQPTNDIKYKFSFKKPSAFYIVGSYPLKTVARGRNGFNVDVAVVLPRVICRCLIIYIIYFDVILKIIITFYFRHCFKKKII